jgi:hypothetical protein
LVRARAVEGGWGEVAPSSTGLPRAPPRPVWRSPDGKTPVLNDNAYRDDAATIATAAADVAVEWLVKHG